jgi:hypothetical protein
MVTPVSHLQLFAMMKLMTVGYLASDDEVNAAQDLGTVQTAPELTNEQSADDATNGA